MATRQLGNREAGGREMPRLFQEHVRCGLRLPFLGLLFTVGARLWKSSANFVDIPVRRIATSTLTCTLFAFNITTFAFTNKSLQNYFAAKRNLRTSSYTTNTARMSQDTGLFSVRRPREASLTRHLFYSSLSSLSYTTGNLLIRNLI